LTTVKALLEEAQMEEEMPKWDGYGRLTPNVTDLVLQAPDNRLFEAKLGELSVVDLFTRRVLWAKLQGDRQDKPHKVGGLARLELPLAGLGVHLGRWVLALLAAELGFLIGLAIPH
jgi:hypothetical protein